MTGFTEGLNEVLRFKLFTEPATLLRRVLALVKLCDRSKPWGAHFT